MSGIQGQKQLGGLCVGNVTRYMHTAAGADIIRLHRDHSRAKEDTLGKLVQGGTPHPGVLPVGSQNVIKLHSRDLRACFAQPNIEFW